MYLSPEEKGEIFKKHGKSKKTLVLLKDKSHYSPTELTI